MTNPDDWLADHPFQFLATRARDWLGWDQWRLSQETATGAVVLACSLLVHDLTKDHLHWYDPFLFLGLFWFWRIQAREIKRYRDVQHAWVIFRIRERFSRHFFLAYILTSLVLDLLGLRTGSGGLESLLSYLSLLLVLACHYFRCVYVPPPPPPRTSEDLVPAWSAG